MVSAKARHGYLCHYKMTVHSSTPISSSSRAEWVLRVWRSFLWPSVKAKVRLFTWNHSTLSDQQHRKSQRRPRRFKFFKLYKAALRFDLVLLRKVRVKMSTALELTGFLLGVASWLITGASLTNDYWKVSSFSGSVIISSRQYENLWHACAEDSTGIAQCRDFESLLDLPGERVFHFPSNLGQHGLD